MEFFDSHSHYNDEKYDNDRKEIIEQTYKNGTTRTVCVGYNLKKSEEALKIANENEYIYSAVGISPNDVIDFTEENLEKIEKLAKSDKVVAIGEIGLDYYWDNSNKEKQKELFIKQIDIANKLEKPIIIHNRDAVMDTLNILKEHSVKKKGIFHCCPFNPELIKEGIKLGFYISFSGNVTFKNAKPEKAIAEVPLNKLLIETDSPYMTPEPFRGTRNNAINVKFVAQKIADLTNKPVEEIAQITYDNANRIFNIK